jgi:hypothetical protein
VAAHCRAIYLVFWFERVPVKGPILKGPLYSIPKPPYLNWNENEKKMSKYD